MVRYLLRLWPRTTVGIVVIVQEYSGQQKSTMLNTKMYTFQADVLKLQWLHYTTIVHIISNKIIAILPYIVFVVYKFA